MIKLPFKNTHIRTCQILSIASSLSRCIFALLQVLYSSRSSVVETRGVARNVNFSFEKEILSGAILTLSHTHTHSFALMQLSKLHFGAAVTNGLLERHRNFANIMKNLIVALTCFCEASKFKAHCIAELNKFLSMWKKLLRNLEIGRNCRKWLEERRAQKIIFNWSFS